MVNFRFILSTDGEPAAYIDVNRSLTAVTVTGNSSRLERLITQSLTTDHEFVVGGPEVGDGDDWLTAVPTSDPALLQRALLHLPVGLKSAFPKAVDVDINGDWSVFTADNDGPTSKSVPVQDDGGPGGYETDLLYTIETNGSQLDPVWYRDRRPQIADLIRQKYVEELSTTHTGAGGTTRTLKLTPKGRLRLLIGRKETSGSIGKHLPGKHDQQSHAGTEVVYPAADFQFFHGTIDEFYQKIKREGLVPQSVTGNSTLDEKFYQDGRAARVYLADDKDGAVEYGVIVAAKYGTKKFVVLEIQVPDSELPKLILDEKTSVRAAAYEGIIPPEWIKTATSFYVNDELADVSDVIELGTEIIKSKAIVLFAAFAIRDLKVKHLPGKHDQKEHGRRGSGSNNVAAIEESEDAANGLARRENLKQYLELVGSMGRASEERFTLKNGREFSVEPLTSDEKSQLLDLFRRIHAKDTAKACYRNAWQLVEAGNAAGLDFEYVEGFANSLIPTGHAWASWKGKPIDVTWSKDMLTRGRHTSAQKMVDRINENIIGNAYYGYEIPLSYLRDFIHRNGTTGPVLQDYDNHFKAVMSGKPLW